MTRGYTEQVCNEAGEVVQEIEHAPTGRHLQRAEEHERGTAYKPANAHPEGNRHERRKRAALAK